MPVWLVLRVHSNWRITSSALAATGARTSVTTRAKRLTQALDQLPFPMVDKIPPPRWMFRRRLPSPGLSPAVGLVRQEALPGQRLFPERVHQPKGDHRIQGDQDDSGEDPVDSKG